MSVVELKAVPRAGKSKIRDGYIPAVAYNKDRNVSFSVEERSFDRVFREQSTHGLIEIALEGGETLPALVRSVQMDPRKRTIVHADFYLVTYGQEIEVPVPVHTTGRARGVIEGGILDVVMHNLQVIAPGPRRIPSEVVVDVSHLAVGDSVKAGEISLPEGCRLAVDADLPVIAVLPPQKIVEAEPTEAEIEAQDHVPAINQEADDNDR
ncbi:50S ribosomal protein L25 [Deinococcus peraridilitoris]|uniref:Large ribosomal subunit protein bL25 n=1 Tax=Deinococcus peraridilitoris (strain DSM 19664 / LMG 22246 / CIP 109416 / KR-200) TaxID=937777 RepID=L0A5R3_DEIPD|nr:50S ribosomal protein L25 [Deinococcus peraridilitoris]AFZ68360.1 ribosomal protein L25, Ctc-form [Deinococcus peraridilitoris DSM 19664]